MTAGITTAGITTARHVRSPKERLYCHTCFCCRTCIPQMSSSHNNCDHDKWPLMYLNVKLFFLYLKSYMRRLKMFWRNMMVRSTTKPSMRCIFLRQQFWKILECVDQSIKVEGIKKIILLNI